MTATRTPGRTPNVALRRIAIGAALAPVLVAALAGCGIPTGDDTFGDIPSEEILFGLDEASTTTSTTTTTIPLAPATTEMETTTTIELREQVDIYFLSRNRLQPVPLALTSGFSAGQVVDLLEDGPPDDVALDTLIERGLIVSTDVAGGVITVDLDNEIFSRISASDQTEAIGQIVLSLLRNLRGVGSVLFTIDGEPTQVKKGDSLLTEPDEAVTLDDYEVLLATSPPTTTSTTTTTTMPPDTTVPAEAVPVEGPLDETPATTPSG